MSSSAEAAANVMTARIASRDTVGKVRQDFIH